MSSRHDLERLSELSAADVAPLAVGAALVGSGGGGNVSLGALLLRQHLGRRTLPVVQATSLPDETLVVHTGVVGAPDVLTERFMSAHESTLAVQAVVKETGGQLGAVGIIEVAGINAFTALVAAAALDVPVIDGDLMGRAFPRIGQTTLAVAGHRPEPMALVSPGSDTVVIPLTSPKRAERLVRACTAAMGGAAALAMYPTTAGVLARAGVGSSLSTCVALGRQFIAAKEASPVELVAALGADNLHQGRVDEISPRQGGLPGAITLVDHHDGAVIRIDYLEEFLALSIDGATVACTPDVIVALEPTSRAPLLSDQVRDGQSLLMFTLPALYDWPNEAQDVVGPRAFGLDLLRRHT